MKVILRYILLLFLSIDSAYLNQQIKVVVLYESLCPYSIEFINEQLYPAWKDVGQYVELKLVPYGKSHFLDDKQTFECQHGPKECNGNRIQSCALSGLNNANDQVEYVNCFMKAYYDGGEEVGEMCAKQVGLDWNYVLDCNKTDKGTLLQLEAKNETEKFKTKGVPRIIFNDASFTVVNETLEGRSRSDFKGVVLSLVKDQN